MKRSSDRTKQPASAGSPAQPPPAPTFYSIDKSHHIPQGYDATRPHPSLQMQQQQRAQQEAQGQNPVLPKQPEARELQPQPQQQHQGVPATDEAKGKWKQHVGAARIIWDELTEDELLKLDGRQDKLAGLVQERYAITRDEAEKQVKAFYVRNRI
ncbi:MAG TPA: CsbD family protein [Dongiaceae bacterium]|nr:CsbD family protein [Dongiaceae bacterium]